MAAKHPIELSSYGQASTTPSAVARMMASFADEMRPGVDINLGVGYVNEATIPTDQISTAAQAVLGDPQTYRGVCNYGSPAGSTQLIEAISRFLTHHKVRRFAPADLRDKRMIVGASGVTSLLEAFATVMGPGIVITSDPVYYIYTSLLERMGFEIVAVPEGEDGLEAEAVRQAIAALGDRASEVRFIYAVSVSNPSCVVMSQKNRKGLVKVAHELSDKLGRAVPIVFDAAYELLCHGKASPTGSAIHDDKDDLVYEAGSLSKIIAPALRIGYLIGPEGPLMNAMVQRTSDVGFSAPLLNQQIAAHLLDRDGVGQLKRVNKACKYKARSVKTWLEAAFGDQLEDVTGGDASFYFYITFLEVETHEQSLFYKYLNRITGNVRVDGPSVRMNPRVAYIPGEHCVHPNGRLREVGKRQLRISYAYEDLPNLHRAIEMMGQAAGWALDHDDD